MTDEEIAITLTKHREEIASLKHRMNEVEEINKTTQQIAINVEKLAVNMQNMAEEQKDQGNRLKALEEIPANNWNNVVKTTLTVIVSAIAGGLVTAIFYAVQTTI